MDISIIFTQGMIPLGLLLWQGAARLSSGHPTGTQSQLGWLLKTLLVAAYLGGVSLSLKKRWVGNKLHED
ncbi:hypothetical protein IQ254_07590 [Nodosilinea sp. LEGE 07088]|uniref:hypothetical protein n=1 Tax=Nodosilinea sp. LEGE 07088 TaxID=2777968 RepID=UPI00187E4A4B|nr:hypothetical protein [Nodosilinea sp. LEGE 07088]MBE9137064.1 hypothetical protein [Nodosilinea sp. LEGE 07088]